MTGWRPTAALVRGAIVSGVTSLGALTLGRPDLLVLVAPVGLLVALAIAHAPRAPVSSTVRLGDSRLREGQSTRLFVEVDAGSAVEHATLTVATPAHVVVQPPSGAVSAVVSGRTDLELLFSVRRWGVRPVGTAMLSASSPWDGYRWRSGPLPEQTLTVLPQRSTFTSVESPNPLGLVGQNRSRRAGHGSEFWGIRRFQPGDRLRRVDWRTTLRTRELHTVGTDAQEDSSLLILLDAVTDHGVSEGVDGRASSLDLGVRAASALAAHHLGVGDRVSLRVLGRRHLVLGPGSGPHHLRRIDELLAQVAPGWPDLLSTRLRLRAGAGTVVVVLSPLFTPEVTTAMVTLTRRGLSVVAIDTLPEGVVPGRAFDPLSPGRLAWRMRLLERQMQLTESTRLGVPVVPWNGPGTLDEVFRRLGRRARVPREVTR